MRPRALLALAMAALASPPAFASSAPTSQALDTVLVGHGSKLLPHHIESANLANTTGGVCRFEPYGLTDSLDDDAYYVVWGTARAVGPGSLRLSNLSGSRVPGTVVSYDDPYEHRTLAGDQCDPTPTFCYADLDGDGRYGAADALYVSSGIPCAATPSLETGPHTWTLRLTPAGGRPPGTLLYDNATELAGGAKLAPLAGARFAYDDQNLNGRPDAGDRFWAVVGGDDALPLQSVRLTFPSYSIAVRPTATATEAQGSTNATGAATPGPPVTPAPPPGGSWVPWAVAVGGLTLVGGAVLVRRAGLGRRPSPRSILPESPPPQADVAPPPSAETATVQAPLEAATGAAAAVIAAPAAAPEPAPVIPKPASVEPRPSAPAQPGAAVRPPPTIRAPAPPSAGVPAPSPPPTPSQPAATAVSEGKATHAVREGAGLPVAVEPIQRPPSAPGLPPAIPAFLAPAEPSPAPAPLKACPACGLMILTGARTCFHCTEYLEPCPACGQETGAGLASCHACGAPRPPRDAAGPRPPGL